MNELVRYDTMCSAITECHRLDEVKDIRDKARALEMYARQAKNLEAERKACEIRLRAERRSGELLRELARAESSKGGNTGGATGSNQYVKRAVPNDATPPKSDYAAALESTSLSRQTAHRYQQLADIPKEDFEAALAEPQKCPTTTKLIREIRDPVPEVDRSALWLWGRALDFERAGYYEKTPREIFDSFSSVMQEDMLRIVPMLAQFYSELEVLLNEFARRHPTQNARANRRA